MRHTFSGEGPGPQTPDGCSVEFYRDLPYLGELEAVVSFLKPGMSVIELGCGTGRLCARLLELGCVVTGVDESKQMLKHVPEQVRTLRANIQQLDAGMTYDAVLLASHLINHPDAEVRKEFVSCGRRHLKTGGVFLIKRHSEAWLNAAKVGPVGRVGDVDVFLDSVERQENVFEMTIRYRRASQSWTHSFATVPMSEPAIEELLFSNGFESVQWTSHDRTWCVAFG